MGTSKRRRVHSTCLSFPREVQGLNMDLRTAGLDCCGLIIGIDFTASNVQSGLRSYGGDSLHKLYDGGRQNAYEEVIQIIMATMINDKGNMSTGGQSTSVALETTAWYPSTGSGTPEA